MKNGWKYKVAKVTSGYRTLNKKALTMKSSWDEVSKILNGVPKKKKKK